MKRIDSVNARPDENGLGKAGFNDNADLPGQDATYVTPGWFNTVQEELCNLLELRGITLDPASKRQLYDLLTTQADLEALADEIETNFIRKNQIVDNLTTDDVDKVASARTVKELQDNKLEKTDLKDATTIVKGVSRFATATEVANKSNVSAAVTPSNTATIAQSTDLGVGQTWQDVTSSRSFGITYTNNTGRPIQVAVTSGGGSSNFRAYINGIEIIRNYSNYNTSSPQHGITLIIPNGSTYSFTGGQLQIWAELR